MILHHLQQDVIKQITSFSQQKIRSHGRALLFKKICDFQLKCQHQQGIIIHTGYDILILLLFGHNYCVVVLYIGRVQCSELCSPVNL